MSNSFSKISAIMISGALVLVLFQNCSDVSFTGSDETASVAPVEDGGNEGLNEKRIFTQEIKHTPGEIFPKVDILFVVDESSSMNNVVTELRAGFSSLDASVFPAETQIAFTNMAPARVDTNGVIDSAAAFARAIDIPDLPGFLSLVSKDSIDAALASPNVRDAVKGRFAEPGCTPWFAPAATNANGTPCVQAASQIALLGTGVEAGVVTLFQLSSQMTLRNEKLFRDGAIVNVIFVSDTHDPGFDYYGKANAYSEIMPYAELTANIMANNSSIADLRFNGILPLPEVGNPALTGLNTLGELANTAAEVDAISGEGLHDFSYLDYIKESGGHAFHIVNSDWKASVKSMIQTVGKSTKPLITLPEVCPVLISIAMDNVALNADEYTVINSTTVRIEIEGLKIKEYTISITCED